MNTFVLLLALLVIVATGSYIKYSEISELNRVKSGEYTLECKLTTEGYTIVATDLIKSRVDDVWLFSNGYSRNCKVIK
jgi:hypothetical protein